MQGTLKPRIVTERAAVGDGIRLDRAAGLIIDAKLCGLRSVNGRDYSRVLRNSAAAYEGAKVYLNHPERNAGPGDRDFNDWVGVVENVRYLDGGLFGNIRLRRQHGRFGEICEAVESFPGSFGLSHVADIDSEVVGGVERVLEIREVFSVDIVTDPATTKGVFESNNPARLKVLAEREELLAQIEAASERLKQLKDDDDSAEREYERRFEAAAARAWEALGKRGIRVNPGTAVGADPCISHESNFEAAARRARATIESNSARRRHFGQRS